MFGCQISFAYNILLSVKVNLHYSTSAVLYPYIKLILLNYTETEMVKPNNNEINHNTSPHHNSQ